MTAAGTQSATPRTDAISAICLCGERMCRSDNAQDIIDTLERELAEAKLGLKDWHDACRKAENALAALRQPVGGEAAEAVKRARSSSAIMGMLPEDPGYNGSRLIIDDVEAARVVKDLDETAALIEALAHQYRTAQTCLQDALRRAESAEARLADAVGRERERCAMIARAMYDEWMQEHGADTAYDAGRCTALDNVERAIRATGAGEA